MPSIGVYGPSGHGKSTAIRPPDGIGLNPAETFIICPDMKALPFRGSKVLFPEVYDEKGKIDMEKSRYYSQDILTKADGTVVNRKANSAAVVLQLMKDLEKRTVIKNGVLDTLNHILTHSFLKKDKNLGFERFNQMAEEVYDLINFARTSRINWFILMHSEDAYDKNGELRTKVRSIGKLIDDKIDLPSLFTIMLKAVAVRDESKDITEFKFRTQTNGSDVTKSPFGMLMPFEPNDYGHILQQIERYENASS